MRRTDARYVTMPKPVLVDSVGNHIAIGKERMSNLLFWRCFWCLGNPTVEVDAVSSETTSLVNILAPSPLAWQREY